MEVILRDHVEHVGKRGDVVKVAPGYARNYLLPKGLAYEASEGNKKRIAAEGKARATRQASERAEAQGMAAWVSVDASKLEGVFKKAPDRDEFGAARAHGLELTAIAGLVPVSGQMLTHFAVRAERGLATNNITADEMVE